MTSRNLVSTLLALPLLLAGCGPSNSSTNDDDGTLDAGPDATLDVASDADRDDADDAGTEVGGDVSPDAVPDALDDTTDASGDANPDTPSDVSDVDLDADLDADSDADSSTDADTDTGRDADTDTDADATAYTVGGTVSGMTGDTLVLQNNGADDFTIDDDGAFTFATPIDDGTTYDVTIATQPSGDDTCFVQQGSGTIAGADVSDVDVQCGAPVRILEFTAAERVVLPGERVQLTWAVNNAASCTIVNVASGAAPVVVRTPEFGSAPQTVDASTTFTLTCQGFAGPVERSVDVRVTDTDWSSLAVGTNHVCAITEANALYCWGRNLYGQLGDDTEERRYTPVQEATAGTEWAGVAVGWGHTCAIDTSGILYCWGDNAAGQLGIDSNESQTTPTPVDSSLTWVQVSAGVAHTCALSSDDEVYCWGDNDLGQLGDGTTSPRYTPTREARDTTWRAVAAGSDHTCAITTGGTAFCWGSNSNGQLGDVEGPSVATPRVVAGTRTYEELVAGADHTCAITDGNELYCWGANDVGMLGDGSRADRYFPVREATDATNWTSLGAGRNGTCAVNDDDEAYCWGQAVSSVNSVTVPTAVTGRDGAVSWTQVDVGASQMCGRTTDGTIRCAGETDFGVHGDGGPTFGPEPIADDGQQWARVISGPYETCAITVDGELACWGRVGDTSREVIALPTSVDGPARSWTDLSSASRSRCGVTDGSEIYCWGLSSTGLLGVDETELALPTQEATSRTDWADVDMGADHACATTTSGQLYCWGTNDYDVFGEGVADANPTPVRIATTGLTWSQISLGSDYTCGISTDDELYCWGRNDLGQLGDSTTTSRGTFETVDGDAQQWAVVSVGWIHACALTQAGEAYCWGDNDQGQLGNGTTDPALVPTLVAGPDRQWRDISAGGEHTCAVTTDDEVWCWGENSDWQLGDGTGDQRTVPTREVNADSNFATVSAGLTHTCATRVDGRISCWGSRDLGKRTVDVRVGPVWPHP